MSKFLFFGNCVGYIFNFFLLLPPIDLMSSIALWLFLDRGESVFLLTSSDEMLSPFDLKVSSLFGFNFLISPDLFTLSRILLLDKAFRNISSLGTDVDKSFLAWKLRSSAPDLTYFP